MPLVVAFLTTINGSIFEGHFIFLFYAWLEFVANASQWIILLDASSGLCLMSESNWKTSNLHDCAFKLQHFFFVRGQRKNVVVIRPDSFPPLVSQCVFY